MIAIHSPINVCAKLLHSIGASCVPGHLNDTSNVFLIRCQVVSNGNGKRQCEILTSL